jgi:hypothetical protein
MAKLDFLVRYPEFYEKLAKHLGQESSTPLHDVESSMVRFRYGPWDDRYYHVLAYLESRGLVSVGKDRSTYQFALTQKGMEIANALAGSPTFSDLSVHMNNVKALVGKLGGTKLKELIYGVFSKEVVDRKLGEPIL